MSSNKDKQSRDLHYNLRPDEIIVEPEYNQRIDFSKKQEIKESIRAVGLKYPLIVKVTSEGFFLRDGQTRLESIKELIAEGEPIERIKCAPMGKMSPLQEALIPVTANVSKEFTDLEKGRQFNLALRRDPGSTVADIVRETGLLHLYISNCILLANSPTVMQKLLIDGTIASNTAIEILKLAENEGWDNLKLVQYLSDLLVQMALEKKKKITPAVVKKITGGSGRTLKKIGKELIKSHEIVEINEDSDRVVVSMSLKEWEDFTKSIK